MNFARAQLGDDDDVVELPVDELAFRILRLIVEHQQGHLLSRSHATVHGSWSDDAADAPDNTYLRAIGEAWDWLYIHGLIAYNPNDKDWAYVTRRGKHVNSADDGLALVRAGTRIELDLHERLRERIPRQFLLGEYELAAFAAMREVEIRIRELADAAESEIGVKLARRAFNPEKGALSNPDLDGGERVAMMELFAGALGVFKNPPSHRQVEFENVTVASEVVLLADLLLRLLDGVQRSRRWRQKMEEVMLGKRTTMEESGDE
jgi:uncharacterized protein (TIGR02391 family)